MIRLTQRRDWQRHIPVHCSSTCGAVCPNPADRTGVKTKVGKLQHKAPCVDTTAECGITELLTLAPVGRAPHDVSRGFTVWSWDEHNDYIIVIYRIILLFYTILNVLSNSQLPYSVRPNNFSWIGYNSPEMKSQDSNISMVLQCSHLKMPSAPSATLTLETAVWPAADRALLQPLQAC